MPINSIAAPKSHVAIVQITVREFPSLRDSAIHGAVLLPKVISIAPPAIRSESATVSDIATSCDLRNERFSVTSYAVFRTSIKAAVPVDADQIEKSSENDSRPLLPLPNTLLIH